MAALTAVTVKTAITAVLLLEITAHLAHLCACTFAVPPGWSLLLVQQTLLHQWGCHLA